MDTGVKVSIVVAMDKNTRAIGREGKLPWYLRDDLKRFKLLTIGKTVIAGRKTHDSILDQLGHPLPGRQTIVLTRTSISYPGCFKVADSWEHAMSLTRGEHEVFVIGGAEIYALALPHTSTIYLTLVHNGNVKGDTFFPNYDPMQWHWSDYSRHSSGENNECPFDWWTLRKIHHNMDG